MLINMYRASLLILLSFLFSMSVLAEEPSGDIPDEKISSRLWEYLTVGASITAGVGGRSVTIDVTRQGTNDHGRIVENRADEFFLLYSTRASYFDNSSVGYAWLFNVSTINLKDQELASGNIVQLGTEVNGYFATVVPTVFYNFGDRHHGHYLRAGIGLGIGVANFEGDIVLTESTKSNDRVTISNGTSDIFLGVGIFLDYQWENFALRLSSAGPNLDYKGYDINVAGTSLMFGYTYYLE